MPGEAWYDLAYAGLPKEKLIQSWSDLRWIGKAPSLQKYYLRWLIRALKSRRSAPETTALQVLRFREGRSVLEITGLVGELLFFTRSFGIPLAVATLDNLTAFELITHDAIERAMSDIHSPAWIIFAIILEFGGLQARAEIPGAGCTPTFALSRSGPMGRTDTPEFFNLIMELALGHEASVWEAQGLGVALPLERRSLLLTAYLWEDNLVLFSSTVASLRKLVAGASTILAANKLAWKPSSLEYLAGSALWPSPETLEVPLVCSAVASGMSPATSVISINKVKSLKLLGTLFDEGGSTSAMVSHRRLCAQLNLAKHRDLSSAPLLPPESKIEGWCRGPRASATFGLTSAHWTKTILLGLRT